MFLEPFFLVLGRCEAEFLVFPVSRAAFSQSRRLEGSKMSKKGGRGI